MKEKLFSIVKSIFAKAGKLEAANLESYLNLVYSKCSLRLPRTALFRLGAVGILAITGVGSSTAETLYNGITLPTPWPPVRLPTQQYLVPSYITSPPSVIPIDVGRQLFVDDFLIESTNMTRTVHRPVIHPTPILSPTSPADNYHSGIWAQPFSDGVWYDPARQLFRMWYWSKGGPNMNYAYSSDGMNWTKPDTTVISTGGGRDSSTVWMDLDDPNSARRFKAFIYTGGAKQSVFYSADGQSWSDQGFKIESLSDRTTFFKNPFRNKWIGSLRSGASLPAVGSLPTRPSRSRYYAESDNLSTWTPSNMTDSFWYATDELDPPYPGTTVLPQLYNMDAVAYESVIVGLMSIYYAAPTEIVELGVGFSRDGFQWVRPTRGSGPNAFIPVPNQDGVWNAFNSQSAGGCFLVVGDELWFYFSARNGRHGIWPSVLSTGLAKMRRDGFYSMNAGGSQGTLTTRRIRFNGNKMFVNVKAPSGSLQAEILDENGNVIAPFSRANSNAVSVDKTKQEMTWSGASSLSSVSGRNVKVRFYLTNGELYSFWVTANPNGASNGYVAAGGPQFTASRDIGSGTVDTLPPDAPRNLTLQ